MIDAQTRIANLLLVLLPFIVQSFVRIRSFNIVRLADFLGPLCNALLDERASDAILDARTGVEGLDLGRQKCRPLEKTAQTNERRVAERREDVVVDFQIGPLGVGPSRVRPAPRRSS